MIKLWVDDHPNRDPEKLRPGEEWHWVKTITEAIRVLDTMTVTEVSLDHDISIKVQLGEGEPRPFASPETFAPVARFIRAATEAGVAQDTWPRHSTFPLQKVYLHSASTPGRHDMEQILKPISDIVPVIHTPQKACNKYEEACNKYEEA